ncbi:MAG: hypothetical protein N3F65_03090 [Nitrososphaeria archaeon]|nr:hypothetical protein [Aigarchaeota archaeon]MCX8187576.1 hypothetical protein [Nitrososphaeria archaeon]MDW8021290.1 hypothetical protein [Nitrososphaerota archaeon]
MTLDLRLASAVKRVASTYNVEVVHAAEPMDLPLDIEVIVTHRNEFPKLDRGKVLYSEDFASVEELVEKAVELTVIGPKYKLAIAAVDPGKNMGAVYMLDGKIIKSRRYGLIEDLVDDVKRFIKMHGDAEKKYLLLGAASDLQVVKRALNEFEKHLRDEGVTIIVCDESFTGKGLIPKVKGMSKDEYAALILTLKNLLKLR